MIFHFIEILFLICGIGSTGTVSLFALRAGRSNPDFRTFDFGMCALFALLALLLSLQLARRVL